MPQQMLVQPMSSKQESNMCYELKEARGGEGNNVLLWPEILPNLIF